MKRERVAIAIAFVVVVGLSLLSSSQPVITSSSETETSYKVNPKVLLLTWGNGAYADELAPEYHTHVFTVDASSTDTLHVKIIYEPVATPTPVPTPIPQRLVVVDAETTSGPAVQILLKLNNAEVATPFNVNVDIGMELTLSGMPDRVTIDGVEYKYMEVQI